MEIYQIKYCGYYASLFGDMANILKFKISLEDQKSKTTRCYFTEEFVEDYFQISGDNNLVRIINQNEKLFLKWALMKIEEALNNNSLPAKIIIDNIEWARVIAEEDKIFQSERVNDDTYLFRVKRPIGFK